MHMYNQQFSITNLSLNSDNIHVAIVLSRLTDLTDAIQQQCDKQT